MTKPNPRRRLATLVESRTTLDALANVGQDVSALLQHVAALERKNADLEKRQESLLRTVQRLKVELAGAYLVIDQQRPSAEAEAVAPTHRRHEAPTPPGPPEELTPPGPPEELTPPGPPEELTPPGPPEELDLSQPWDQRPTVGRVRKPFGPIRDPQPTPARGSWPNGMHVTGRQVDLRRKLDHEIEQALREFSEEQPHLSVDVPIDEPE